MFGAFPILRDGFPAPTSHGRENKMLRTYTRKTFKTDIYYDLVHHLPDGTKDMAELEINRTRSGKIHNIGIGMIGEGWDPEVAIVTGDHQRGNQLRDDLPTIVEAALAAIGYVTA
jgi:hypothetical protein